MLRMWSGKSGLTHTDLLQLSPPGLADAEGCGSKEFHSLNEGGVANVHLQTCGAAWRGASENLRIARPVLGCGSGYF